MGVLVKNKINYTGGGAKEEILTYAQYLALSEEQRNNGTTYYVNDINGDGEDFQPIIYSTDEREVGVWIDGKPLYQKTIELTNTTINTLVNIDLSSYDIDTLVSSVGRFNRITGSLELWYSFDYYYTNNWWSMLQYNSTNDRIEMMIYMDSSESTNHQYITLQYTKTTDSPGSGTWTPQGVPAQHYSTNEQIVGTWVDDSTLYQKTFLVPAANYGANTGTAIWDNSGIDTLVSCNGDFFDGARHYAFGGIYTENGLYIRLVHDTSNTWSTDGIVILVTGSYNLTNAVFKLTIQYTKSS